MYIHGARVYFLHVLQHRRRHDRRQLARSGNKNLINSVAFEFLMIIYSRAERVGYKPHSEKTAKNGREIPFGRATSFV